MNAPSKVSSLILTVVIMITLLPASAAAFCGFYVGGAGSEMFADATQVVLMRDGTRTVLSMQNRYEGPLEDFALVIPVPVVLEEENVMTLQDDVFDRVDMLTSPRLVEYWEQDPCSSGYDYWDDNDQNQASDWNMTEGGNQTEEPGEVEVEAQFKVGEYNIVVLSTQDSTALEDWLIANDYNIPNDAAPYFEPYVQSGMYFFVAQVDPAEVSFHDDQAILSPLRFHYDSADFSLPVRLGMINSRGQQDLIVNVIAQNQRYELANYPNVTIPTNLYVSDAVLANFSAFYRALFAQTLEENPGAAVTEYAWGTAKCDPCPGPVQWGLPADDIETLGADVIPGDLATSRNWVITRLHLRYAKGEIGEDLIFQEADPIVGGRQHHLSNGELESGATPSSYNEFQGRYIARHAWEGDVDCDDPVYGRWGGRWGGDEPSTSTALSPNTTGDEVFPDDDFDLDTAFVGQDGGSQDPGPGGTGGGGGGSDDSQGSGGCAVAPSNGLPGGALLILLGALAMVVIRRRR